MSEAALVYPRVLECPRCGIGLGAETISDVSDTSCPSCSAVFRATLFPLVFGLFIWPFLVLTAPTAIFFALFGWNRPGSVPRGRRRWEAVAGLVCALLQLAGFGLLVLALSGKMFR